MRLEGAHVAALTDGSPVWLSVADGKLEKVRESSVGSTTGLRSGGRRLAVFHDASAEQHPEIGQVEFVQPGAEQSNSQEQTYRKMKWKMKMALY